MMCLFNIFMILLLLQYTTSQFIPNVTEYMSILQDKRDISDSCNTQMSAYLSGLLNNQSWAWNMLDATPKLPYGILTGNLLDMGNYDECMRIKFDGVNGRILGKFCSAAVAVVLPVHLTMEDQLISTTSQQKSRVSNNGLTARSGLPMEPETGIRLLVLSVCIPDACTPIEVLEFTYISTLGLPIIPVEDTSCETVDDLQQLSGADIGFITFIAVILVIVVICAIYDEIIRDKRKPVNPLYVSFSPIRNFKNIIKYTDNQNRIACLDGLRVFSILWVMLGHRFSISEILPYVNKDYVAKWSATTYTQYVQGAPSAVDTFMFLTGLLMAMSFIKAQTKPKAKFNILVYYIHRYLRLTPALAVVYFLHVSVFLHFGSGPYWTYATYRTKENCLNRWASFFFYYQNYLDYNDMCLLHTWYLSMDMQIFILSPIVLLPLARHRKLMMRAGLPILIFLSIACPFIITYIYKTQIFTEDYYNYYYYPTHTRLSAWLIGVFTGSIMYAYRNAKLTIHPILNFCIWVVVVAGMAACIFCGNNIAYNYDRLSTSFYIAFHRPAWCCGLAWVVYACMKGRGGIFNFVLSADFFQPLSRITYSMYLVHVTCLLFNVATVRYPAHFNDQEMIHLFLGDILMTITLAFIWSILFESPIVAIENFIFGRGVTRKDNTEARINDTDRVKDEDQTVQQARAEDVPMQEVQVEAQPTQEMKVHDDWTVSEVRIDSRLAPQIEIEDETTAAKVTHTLTQDEDISNKEDVTNVQIEDNLMQKETEVDVHSESIHDEAINSDNVVLKTNEGPQLENAYAEDKSINEGYAESSVDTEHIDNEHEPTQEGNVKSKPTEPTANIEDKSIEQEIYREDNRTEPEIETDDESMEKPKIENNLDDVQAINKVAEIKLEN